MCEKEVDSMIGTSKLSMLTFKYFNKNKDNIIKKICQEDLFKDKTNSSLSELQDEDNQLQFELNIQRHFQWILDHCKYGTSVFSDYKDTDDFIEEEYEIFYDKAIDYIHSSSEIYTDVQNNLIAYFRHIQNSQ